MRTLAPSVLLALLFCPFASGAGRTPPKAPKKSQPLERTEPAPARVKAAAVLEGDLGLPAFEALERRGLLVTTGSSKPRRIAAISWEALERHVAAAPRLAAFLKAYEAVREGAHPAKALDSFSDLRGLPSGGLMGRGARAALAALADHAAALRALGDGAEGLVASGSLYRTPWGRTLSERTHAELGGPAAEAGAEALFAALTAPHAPSASAAHLAAWAASRERGRLDGLLASDAAAGRPSAELKSALLEYLDDQGRVEALLSAREELSRVEKDAEARRLFDDIRAATPPLTEAGDLTARLKELLAVKDADPVVTLTGPELHVRPAAEEPLEPGDELIVSMAYWVDGLPAGEDTEVVELLYRDDGDQGLTLLSRVAAKRRAGGPHSLMLKTSAAAAGRPTYRLVLDAAGAAPLARETSVDVSDALDGLRRDAAEAESLGRACRLDESSAAWTALIEGLGDDRKPARLRLAQSARARLKAVADWTATKRELDESLDGARLFATKEHCDYRTDRAERALSLLKDLPAGCDRPLSGGSAASAALRAADRPDGSSVSIAAELTRLAGETDARRRLQEGFRTSVARARDREASCKPDEAARLFASAMALLDSDPDARCGDFEKEYAAVRMDDLPRAAAAERLSAALETELGRARRQLDSDDPAAALGTALRLATALGRLPDARCRSGPTQGARDLALAAGVALGPPPAAGLKLAPDPAPAIIDEARRDWERRRAESEVRRNEAESVQAPNAAEEAP